MMNAPLTLLGMVCSVTLCSYEASSGTKQVRIEVHTVGPQARDGHHMLILA